MKTNLLVIQEGIVFQVIPVGEIFIRLLALRLSFLHGLLLLISLVFIRFVRKRFILIRLLFLNLLCAGSRAVGISLHLGRLTTRRSSLLGFISRQPRHCLIGIFLIVAVGSASFRFSALILPHSRV